MKDARGNDITTNNVECMQLINKLEDACVNYEKDRSEYISLALMADPNCTYALTLAALFAIFEGNYEKADQYLSSSSSLLSLSSERERLYHKAVTAFRHSNQIRSIDYHLLIASKFPTDLFNVKMGQVHCLLTGNREKILALPHTALSQTSSKFYLLYNHPSSTSPSFLLPPSDPSIPRNRNESNEERYKREGYLHGMYGFGLVEMNYFQEAEIVARYATHTSLTNHLVDPWSHHAIAHACEEQGKILEGIEHLENLSPQWADRNHFMRSHNWWHLALFYLEKEQDEKVMRIYDQQIFPLSYPEMLAEPQVQINSSSLLWRLALRNISVEKRWQDIDEKIDYKNIPLHPFIDLHFIYVLAMQGNREKLKEIFEQMGSGEDIDDDPLLLSPTSPPFHFAPPPTSPEFPSEHQLHFAHPLDSSNGDFHCGNNESERLQKREEREKERYDFQRRIFLMIAKGVVHHAFGEYTAAYRYLHPSIPYVSLIGGSNAQQDVWVQTYMDCLKHTQRWSDLNQLLTKRVRHRSSSPHFYNLLAQTYLQLNDIPNYDLNLQISKSLRSQYSN